MAIENELRKGISLMTQGKEEGFNILYSYTYNYVYGRAKYIMKDEEDALDLTQETFIQAYKGISTLENADNVYAWLGGIVYRQGMKLFRKKREVLTEEENEDIFENIISEDRDSQPEETADAKATSEIVMDMVNELPELQRAAILAFYYDNMKIEEIAGVFDCSVNTIKSRLNYAKKFLKGKVEEHERQNRYKLCSVSPVILLLAFRKLFAQAGYTLSQTSAQTVYNAACDAVGLVPSVITAGYAAGQAAAGSTAANVGTGATVGAVSNVGTAAAAIAKAGTAADVAVKTGLTLGAKVGIALAAAAVTGGVALGAFAYNKAQNNTPPTPPEIITESTEFTEAADSTETAGFSETEALTAASAEEAENVETAETAEELSTEPIAGAYWKEFLTGEYNTPDGKYKILISNVQADSNNESDVTYDVYFESYDSYSDVTQTVNADGVTISNYVSTFEGVSSTGYTWYPRLQFMHDGSIYFGADMLMPEGYMGSITSLHPIILLKTDREISLQPDTALTEGTYIFEEGYDSYVLTVSNLRNVNDYQLFDLKLVINSYSGGGRTSEETLGRSDVIYQNGIASFMNEEYAGDEFFGYFTLTEDGSLALSYDVLDEVTTWVKPYNTEPVILAKNNF